MLFGPPEPPAKKPARDPRVRSLKETFDRLHREHVHGEPAVFGDAKDSALLKRMLADRDDETLARLMVRFFVTADAWVRERGFSIGLFHFRLPALVAADARARVHERVRPSHPLLDAISVRLSRHDFYTWFAGVTVETDGTGLTRMSFPDRDRLAFCMKHYGHAIDGALTATGLGTAAFSARE